MTYAPFMKGYLSLASNMLYVQHTAARYTQLLLEKPYNLAGILKNARLVVPYWQVIDLQLFSIDWLLELMDPLFVLISTGKHSGSGPTMQGGGNKKNGSDTSTDR